MRLEELAPSVDSITPRVSAEPPLERSAESFGHARSPPKIINLINPQNGRPKAKPLKFKSEWLRAFNDQDLGIHGAELLDPTG
jgi:hypothetical protein